MLPQVVVLIAGGTFVTPFVRRVGLDRAAWLSAVAVVAGLAVTGTILAALFTGDLARSGWTAQQTTQFREAVTVAALALTVVAAALIGWGIARTRHAATGRAATPVDGAVPAQARRPPAEV
ncbi:hypothetical protein AB0G15_14310 [Streptosporangium sp. NPDC023825]|uniref:hypothetical protein n=1 Tax=Streptosporangium sp. NPDC023825 TaxID=3154909 RepID=UPI00342F831D